MPQNKPMKIQWIYHGGRSIPLVLPQTYSYKDDDWKITSDQDPLPVVEYGTTAGGIVVPKRVSDEGHELTQLTGSNMEKIDITQEVGVIAAGGNKRVFLDLPERTKSISLYIRALAGRISSAHIEFRNLNPSYGSPINSIELTPVASLPSSAPVFKKEELVSDGVGIRIEADSGTDVELQFAIVYCWRD